MSALAMSTRFIKRMADAMARPPTCAECEGEAETGWQAMPFGRIYGLCSHCVERYGQSSLDHQPAPEPR
jgi:hypothetical protein